MLCDVNSFQKVSRTFHCSLHDAFDGIAIYNTSYDSRVDWTAMVSISTMAVIEYEKYTEPRLEPWVAPHYIKNMFTRPGPHAYTGMYQGLQGLKGNSGFSEAIGT